MQRNGPDLPSESQRCKAELAHVRVCFRTDVFENHMLDLNDLLNRNGISAQQRFENQRNEVKGARESCLTLGSKREGKNRSENEGLRGEFFHVDHEDVDDFVEDRGELRD